MSTRASASNTNRVEWSKDNFIRRTFFNEPLERPARYEPMPKEPGSFELTSDGWVEHE